MWTGEAEGEGMAGGDDAEGEEIRWACDLSLRREAVGEVLGAKDAVEGAKDRFGIGGRPLPMLAMLSTGVRLLRPEAVDDESDPKGLLDLPHPLSRSFFQSSSDLTAGSVVAAPLAGLGRAPLGRGSVRARAVRALTDLRRAVERR